MTFLVQSTSYVTGCTFVFFGKHMLVFIKGGFKSENIGGFLLLQKNISNYYPEQKI